MAARTAGYPRALFAEGIASAYEGHQGLPAPFYVYSQSFDELDIFELMNLSSTELGNLAEGYEHAGRFSAYLIGQHGVASYVDLYAELVKRPALEEVDAVFQDVLNVSLADSVAGFGPPWTTDNYDPQLTECNAPGVAWDGQLLAMKEFVFCSNDNAIGPYDGDRIAVEYTLDVPADGYYELRLAGDDQEATVVPDYFNADPFIGVSILPCQLGIGGYMETRVNGTPRLAPLRAGRHSLRLLGSRELLWVVSFTLKRLE